MMAHIIKQNCLLLTMTFFLTSEVFVAALIGNREGGEGRETGDKWLRNSRRFQLKPEREIPKKTTDKKLFQIVLTCLKPNFVMFQKIFTSFFFLAFLLFFF